MMTKRQAEIITGALQTVTGIALVLLSNQNPESINMLFLIGSIQGAFGIDRITKGWWRNA